jgi:hypothetical protein
MSVWMCCPAARPEEQSTVPLWRSKGYKTALWRDPGAPPIKADLIIMGEYPGHSVSNNRLIKTVLDMDPTCNWCVSAGDDVEPDQGHAPEDIARECEAHFAPSALMITAHPSFGVMQPTGDRWLEDHYRKQFPDEPAHIDRICGSPWIGREFCQRINQGLGPWWPEYFHMFNDEEMQNVTKRLGILWQRRDLTHMHKHWARSARPTSNDMPKFLERANSPENWNAMKAIYDARKAAGFPGSEPL